MAHSSEVKERPRVIVAIPTRERPLAVLRATLHIGLRGYTPRLTNEQRVARLASTGYSTRSYGKAWQRLVKKTSELGERARKQNE